MELKILEERPNPLLRRTEYRFELTHADAATPTIEAVRAELCQQLKVPKDRLVIESMHPRFGAPRTLGEAMSYQSADALKSIVRDHIQIRNKLQEKPVPATPGAAPTPPAAPTEPAAPTAPKS